MQSTEHKRHIAENCSYQRCPECRADTSRRFAQVSPFRHLAVPQDARHSYYQWLKARLDAIRTGENGGDTVEARQWYRFDFMPALQRRISSHMPNQSGRKHAPDYAKYHLASYGNDYRYLHSM